MGIISFFVIWIFGGLITAFLLAMVRLAAQDFYDRDPRPWDAGDFVFCVLWFIFGPITLVKVFVKGFWKCLKREILPSDTDNFRKLRK